MKTVLRAALAAAIVTAMGAGTALAQHDRDRDEHFRRDEHWGGDPHRFADHDLAYWRGGHWFNGFHDGRPGWWWIVGPNWYVYPAPVYPYPDPYLPPGMAPGATATWYYCDNPQGYYPYVPSCALPWRPVAAQ
jgi:hypothetical protein